MHLRCLVALKLSAYLLFPVAISPSLPFHCAIAMASFGKVLDLFDDRHLELQDVTGNVEPLPTLVPYSEYTQNAFVYSMDTNQELFMALMQDFTERTAIIACRELWTWCVQWKVEPQTLHDNAASAHSPKKPRLDAEQLGDHGQRPQPQRKGHILNIIEHRVIDPLMMREEEMLRILIDIIQVESSVVPNFIEFLYRWIDYYEGDGKALKAALRWEIPSLWDFEYHPLVLPTSLKEEDKIEARTGSNTSTTEKSQAENDTPTNESAEEVRQASPTKRIREKPDLAAMERQTEASERLKYREVHYGIKLPYLNDPLPPLINIPRESYRRSKYYAACFKSRQRALNLVLEAGITTKQINNYKKRQTEHPRDTPEVADGNGLRYYQKDAKFAQVHFVEKEKLMQLRDKQMEITISNKLAAEAQLATRVARTGDSHGAPLIPPTPSYVRHPDMATDMMRAIQAARGKSADRISVVPTPLVGLMKSKLFEGAKDKQMLKESLARHNYTLPKLPEDGGAHNDGSDDNDSGGSDMDDQNTPAVSNNTTSTTPIPTAASHPNAAPLPPPNVPYPAGFTPTPSAPQPPLPAASMPSHQPLPTAASILSSHNVPAHIVEYLRNLTTAQAQQLVPLLNANARRALAVTQGVGPLGPATSPYAPFNLSGTATQHASILHQSSINMAGPSQPVNAQGISTMAQQPSISQPNLRQPQSSTGILPQAPQFHSSLTLPAAPNSSAPTLPSAFGNQLQAGMGQGQPNLQLPGATSLPPGPLHQMTLPVLPGPPPTQISTSPLPPPNLPSPNLFRLPPLPSLTRTPPSPLHLAPPAVNSLRALKIGSAPSLVSSSSCTTAHARKPVQIFLPGVLIPGNTIGPSGLKMGNSGSALTDALLIGHCVPGSGKIVLNLAVFLPVGVWENTLRRVRKGAYSILETYPSPKARLGLGVHGEISSTAKDDGLATPHKAVYEKLAQAYSIMASARDREAQLTKRWRTSKGPMTLVDRGAVWEGWAAVLDRGIEMSARERKGALLHSGLVDEGVEGKRRFGGAEAERRRREIEELLEEEEMDVDEEMER